MSTISTYPYDAIYNRFFGLPNSSLFDSKTDHFVDEVTRLEDGTYKLVVEVPGFAKEHVTVQAKDSVLTVNLKNQTKEKKAVYRLGKSIDQEKITATCKDGILTVICPMREPATKTVNVNVDWVVLIYHVFLHGLVHKIYLL